MPRRAGLLAFLALAVVSAPGALTAQTGPVFEGIAYRGDAPFGGAWVLLHHVSEGEQGTIDSIRLPDDGAFRFVLPAAPDPAQSDIYFATLRHHDVVYFSPAVTSRTPLDTVYAIQAWDTVHAATDGSGLSLQSRSVFFEPDTIGWRVTDLFQLRNDQDRTVVRPSDEGHVWSYPLPTEAANVETGEGEISLGVMEFEEGELVVREAIPPGERIFVARYSVESPLITIPNRGMTEALDVLVREPAPAVEVEGLEMVDRIELEAGSTYIRFSGVEIDAPAVRVVQGEEQARPQVEWVALLLAMVLAGFGVYILKPSTQARPAAAGAPPARRGAILERIAHLDEEFEGSGAPSAERPVYERRRRELLRQLKLLD